MLVLGWLLVPSAAAELVPSYVGLYADLLTEYTESVDAEVGTRVDYRGLRDEPRWPALLGELAKV